MKIAIVIGVSEYDNLSNLYACKNDSNLMNILLESTGEYDDILLVNKETNSVNIKEKLFGYIKAKKEELESENIPLEEVLFYYSGHGTYREEEFYYTTSDFDINKLRTTSIENSELDDALRSLNPKLTIKIVDACESGTRYIKNSDDINFKYLDNTKGKFKDCYFLYSSHSDQNSIAGKVLSYFTEVFIESIISRECGKIRYRDIADYISDKFEELNLKQKPYYINQSSNTEQFCNITDSLKKNLEDFINKISSEVYENLGDKIDDKENKSLIDILMQDAQNYCKDIDEVNDILNEIKLKIESIDLSYNNLNLLYESNIITSQESLEYINNIESVANSINQKEYDYFVKYDYENRQFKKKVLNKWAISPLLPEKDRYTYETITKSVICGYRITERTVPYDSLYIELNPILHNISKYTCYLVYAFSRFQISIYYCINKCRESSWDIYEEPSNKEWSEISCLIKDKEQVIASVEQIKEKFLEYIYNDLSKKFNFDNNIDN